MKIGIMGSAGTGKSSLGLEIANVVGAEFLPAKNITRVILDREKYDWSSEVHVERFLANSGCQKELLDKSIEIESQHDNFVVDRTSIDFAAYAIAESCWNTDEILKLINICEHHARSYTHLILCMWGLVPPEDNKVRTLNPWYQFLIHTIEIGLISSWGMDVTGCILNAPDIEGKTQMIRDALRVSE